MKQIVVTLILFLFTSIVVLGQSTTIKLSEHCRQIPIREAYSLPDEGPHIEVRIPHNPFYMAVKSNLFYDIALIPNIGVEFYLGKKWSIVGNWHYTWLYTDVKHRYWQTYGGNIELRKYFGQHKPLAGFYTGLYAQTNTFDIEFGHKGWQQADWRFGGGISLGYSLPIAYRFNLDFNLGLGYYNLQTDEYVPQSDFYLWQSRTLRHWFGPTKAEISIVWLIGRGNYNIKKK